MFSLALTPDGQLFVGTEEGVYVGRGGRFERLNAELPLVAVASLQVDGQDSLWVGTNAGLMRFTDTPFITIDSHQGLADDYVRALLQTREGEPASAIISATAMRQSQSDWETWLARSRAVSAGAARRLATAISSP